MWVCCQFFGVFIGGLPYSAVVQPGCDLTILAVVHIHNETCIDARRSALKITSLQLKQDLPQVSEVFEASRPPGLMRRKLCVFCNKLNMHEAGEVSSLEHLWTLQQALLLLQSRSLYCGLTRLHDHDSNQWNSSLVTGCSYCSLLQLLKP